jgi:hypothetical protein
VTPPVAPVVAQPRPSRRRAVGLLWSLVALLAVATAVVAIVLSSKAGEPTGPGPAPTPVSTPASTTQSTGPTAPRPFPAFTAGGTPGTR